MSYDLMVFDPEAAPRGYQAFLEWYTKVTEWSEGQTYDDASITSVRLRSWLAEIQRTYPDMNSFENADLLDPEDGSLSSYSIGAHAIYACFAWSQAENAYRSVFDLAAKHGVGFFDVSSSEGSVWLPAAGSLKLAYKKEPSTFLARVKHLFRKTE